jgi:response regulator of citrate/malate metabolism
MTKDDERIVLTHFHGIQMALHRWVRTRSPLEDTLKVIQDHIDCVAGMDGKDQAEEAEPTQSAFL